MYKSIICKCIDITLRYVTLYYVTLRYVTYVVHGTPADYSHTVWHSTTPFVVILTCKFTEVIGHVKPSVVGPTILHVNELNRSCSESVRTHTYVQAHTITSSKMFTPPVLKN